MKRFLIACLLISMGPLTSRAATISVQGGPITGLDPGAGPQLILLISGTDYYTDSNLRISINGGVGPAPRVSAVFGDTSALISPGTLLAGSVWEGGTGGIAGSPNGTTFDSSGLTTVAGFQTAGATSQNTAGVYAVLTFDISGVPFGDYVVSLAGTDLFNGLDPETFEPIPVPLDAQSFTIRGGNTPASLTAMPSPQTTLDLGDSISPNTAVELLNAVTLKNSGPFPFNVLTATIDGPNADLFEVVFNASLPNIVYADSQSKFGVRFLGSGDPGSYQADLHFTFNTQDPVSYPLVAVVVPEPASIVLIVLGIAGVLLIRTRSTLKRCK